MIKDLKNILDQILLGFWIGFGVTLFQLFYDYGFRFLKKVMAIITTV